jgi:hypothetical protein
MCGDIKSEEECSQKPALFAFAGIELPKYIMRPLVSFLLVLLAFLARHVTVNSFSAPLRLEVRERSWLQMVFF